MKKFIKNYLIICSILIFFAWAALKPIGQDLPIDPETKHITYTGIVEVPAIPKTELYSRATEWFSKNYGSANTVLQVQDKHAGKLIAKAQIKPTVKSVGTVYDAGNVKYTISVYVEDNKFKYKLTDFMHEKGKSVLGNGGELEKATPGCCVMVQKQWLRIKSQVDENAKDLVKSLIAAMNKQVKAKFNL